MVGLHLGFIPCIGPTRATIVGLQRTGWLLMDSAVNGARVDIITMLRSMILYTGHLLLPQDWNYLGSTGQMGSILVEFQWSHGREANYWDTMCPDNYAPSYIASATSEGGLLALLAEDCKCHLNQNHLFISIAIETSVCVFDIS